MNIKYIHPVNKTKSILQEDRSLIFDETNEKLDYISGCYDFVSISTTSEDREHYDDHYLKVYKEEPKNLNFEYLDKLWCSTSKYNILINTIGDVNNKKILLLGNGLSIKEFTFLLNGARIVYTDISIQAVQQSKNLFEKSELYEEYKENIEFQTVDALRLPYIDNSYDIIYGCAFVHHLRDLSTFFTEVNRCLKSGGLALFLDDAYSPWWQLLKKTILKPIQLLSHWKTGISPEDKYATRRGGYRKKEIEDLFQQFGFNSVIYKRGSLFEHLFRRGIIKMANEKICKPFADFGKFIDKKLLSSKFIKKNGITLIWGAIKE